MNLFTKLKNAIIKDKMTSAHPPLPDPDIQNRSLQSLKQERDRLFAKLHKAIIRNGKEMLVTCEDLIDDPDSNLWTFSSGEIMSKKKDKTVLARIIELDDQIVRLCPTEPRLAQIREHKVENSFNNSSSLNRQYLIAT